MDRWVILDGEIDTVYDEMLFWLNVNDESTDSVMRVSSILVMETNTMLWGKEVHEYFA
jgi:hypothetical protein